MAGPGCRVGGEQESTLNLRCSHGRVGGSDALTEPTVNRPEEGPAGGGVCPAWGGGLLTTEGLEPTSLFSFCLRKPLDDKRKRKLATACQNTFFSPIPYRIVKPNLDEGSGGQKNKKPDYPSNINAHTNLCVCKHTRTCTQTYHIQPRSFLV